VTALPFPSALFSCPQYTNELMTTNQPDMFEVTDPSINVFKHVIRPLIEHSLKNEDSTHNGQYKSGRSSQQCIVNKIHSRHVCLLSQSHGENKE